MSVEMSQADTTADKIPAHIQNELNKTNSTRLKKKVRTIWHHAQEAAHEKIVNVEVHYDDGRLTNVVVKTPPEDEMVTSHRAQIILGPRGGVRTADFETITGETDLSDVRNRWSRIKSSLQRMR